MIPPGYKIADISFDASDPWDASSLESSELVIFKVPLDFPILQLSGKNIDMTSTLKIRTDNERSSYLVEELDEVGELDQVKLMAADSKTKTFKLLNAPISKYYAIRPKVTMPLCSTIKGKSRKRQSPESEEKKSKKRK